jgi:tungstate transport system ATP-binding protein
VDPNRTLFELDGIALGYAGRTVVSVDKLQFNRGGMYVLRGPNGSGKTTLLRALNGFLAPISGTITFEGVPLHSRRDTILLRRAMTLISQRPMLFNTTVYANVAFGLRARGVSRAETDSRVREILNVVGIAPLSRRNARGLSGGEAQLAALARALVIEPDALLLDEPTANVDAANTETIEALIRNTAAAGRATVIFSTHNAGQASRLAGTPVLLDNGTITV